MSAPGGSPAPAAAPVGHHRGVERAPRLRPDQLLADSITRTGRFAAVDPREPHPLPSLGAVAGVVAWALFVGVSFWRAIRSAPDRSPDVAA